MPPPWLRPRVVLGSCAVILAVVSVRSLCGAFTARVTPPALLGLEARRTLDRAGDLGARWWAPESFDEAEVAFRSSREEQHREEARWLPFRDFRRARSGYQRAIDAAKRAEQLAAAGATDRLEARLALAEGVVEEVVELTRGVGLERVESRSLRLARLKLSEAHIRADSREFQSADLLAREALSHARRGAERIGARAARYLDEGHVRQWCAWQESTVRWSRRHRAAAIVVNKERNSLTLYVDGKLERTFHADMGQTQLAAKLRAEDGATPEGHYFITRKKGQGRSTYYKALELSYPNEDDRRRHREAVRAGRVSSAVGAGNLIEIHGHGGRGRDWTRGCVALSDRDVDDLFDAVVVGTPVTIIGGDGRGGRFSSLAARLIAAQRSIDAYAEH